MSIKGWRTEEREERESGEEIGARRRSVGIREGKNRRGRECGDDIRVVVLKREKREHIGMSWS